MNTPVRLHGRRRARRSLASSACAAGAFSQAADVVVYDHRVHPRLLRLARPDAERIDVGAGGAAARSIRTRSATARREGARGQDRRAPQVGRSVRVRQRRQGSAVPARAGHPLRGRAGHSGGDRRAAYAGVPITYPDAGDVVVAHPRARRGDRQAGRRGLGGAGAPARHAGLLRRAPARSRAMAEALVAHGRNEDESAALIYDGTLAVTADGAGTLGDDRRTGSTRIGAALLVVGSVVGLRDHLRWFDERPLFGKRIVVTRSREQAGELVEMLEDRGAEAILAPTIQIAAARGHRRARPRLRGGRHLRLADLHQRQRRRPLHGAAARDRRHPRPQRGPHLHGRAVHRRPAGPLRAPHRPHAGRVPRRRRRAAVQGPWTAGRRARSCCRARISRGS